jgi:hypothetical protein
VVSDHGEAKEERQGQEDHRRANFIVYKKTSARAKAFVMDGMVKTRPIKKASPVGEAKVYPRRG